MIMCVVTYAHIVKGEERNEGPKKGGGPKKIKIN